MTMTYYFLLLADMCSLQVLPEYTLAFADHPDPGDAVVQWIPFIIVVFLGLFIVVSVAIIYFLYTTKSVKFHVFAEYHTGTKRPTDSRIQHGFMSPSLTMETQLSICAFEDETFAAVVPSHVVYSEMKHNRLDIGITDGCVLGSSQPVHVETMNRTSLPDEIILSAHQLTEDLQSPSFVSDSPGRDYYSSHSLPIDSDNEKHETNQKGSKKRANSRCALDFDDLESPYVQIRREYQERPLSSGNNLNHSKNASLTERRNVPGIVHRCRQVGTSLIHGVIWSREHGADQVATRNTKLPLSFTELRRSLRKFGKLENKSYSQSTTDIVSGEIEQSVSDTPLPHEDGKSPPAMQAACSPVMQEGNTRNEGGRLKNFRNFLRRSSSLLGEKRNSSKCPVYHDRSKNLTFDNEAFEGHLEEESKHRKSTLRKIKVPGIFSKFSKAREHQ